MGPNGFKHLDPTATKIYQSTVMYGFETSEYCFYAKVKNGYLIQTPFFKPWARGQHIDTLKGLGITYKALWLVQ